MSKCASALPDVTYSTAQVAKRYRVGIHKVLTLIGRGELAAVNVSLSARPQWRITAEALADFELRRAAQPKQTARRRKTEKYKYEFF